MSKNFIKYLSILSVVILTGISGLNANSIANNEGKCSLTQAETSQKVSLKPIQQNDHNNLLFDVAESQEVENEESASKTTIFSFQHFLAEFYNIPAFEGLSIQSHKDLNCYKNYFDKSSTKLHVRLQVFII